MTRKALCEVCLKRPATGEYHGSPMCGTCYKAERKAEKEAGDWAPAPGSSDGFSVAVLPRCYR